MKLTTRLLALLLLAVCAVLCACEAPTTPEEAARRARVLAIGDKLLAYGERKGIATPDDVAFIREIGSIAVTTDVAPKPPETTSGK